MSSHHVVREAQEPALFLLSIHTAALEQLGPLLEWSPTLLVSAAAFEQVQAQGIKADMLVATPAQQAQWASLIELQAPLRLINAEDDPLMSGLRYLAQKQHRAVNVYTLQQMNLEEILNALAGQELIPNIVLLNPRHRYALCRNGIYRKWYPAHETIGVYTPQLAGISTIGLEPVAGSNNKLTREFSNLTAGTITIQASQPFWVIEELE